MNELVITTEEARKETNFPYIKGTRRDAEYQMFVDWSCLPVGQRIKMGIPTQNDFAKKYGIDISTLSEWKKRPDFYDQLKENTKRWAKSLTPSVIQEMFAKIHKKDFDNPKYIELWLKYVEDFKDKDDTPQKPKSEFTEDNLHYLISLLPTEDQRRFYETIGELINRAKSIRDDRLREIRQRSDQFQSDIEIDVSEQTDIVNETRGTAGQMAEEATSDIRGRLEERS